MINEVLAAERAHVGFTSRQALDESEQEREKTRLAVARAKQGDQEALRFLYVRYSHNIYGYVRSIMHDEHEAEDVTQHVFAKLMTAIERYDDVGVPFFAWLLRLARNVAIDHLRANRLTPTENVIDPDMGRRADFERTHTVKDALATLPAEQRQVVILRHVVGLTPGEIADRMGRTEGSIHGLHHRGRRALQRELERLDSAPFTKPAGGRSDRIARSPPRDPASLTKSRGRSALPCHPCVERLAPDRPPVAVSASPPPLRCPARASP